MNTRHSIRRPFSKGTLVMAAAILVLAMPANLAALGSREAPKPATEETIRQAAAAPYNAPAETGDTAQ